MRRAGAGMPTSSRSASARSARRRASGRGGSAWSRPAAHRTQRVQAGERILEDHRDAGVRRRRHGPRRGSWAWMARSSRMSPPAIRRPGLEWYDDGRAGERLACTRLAHHAEHPPRAMSKETSSSATQVPGAGGEIPRAGCVPTAAAGRRRYSSGRCAVRSSAQPGRRASRSQSPSRFTDSASSSSVSREERSTTRPENRQSWADADQGVPGWAGWRHAHAEEGQRHSG